MVQRFVRLYNLLIIGANNVFGFTVQSIINFCRAVGIVNLRPPIMFPLA